MHGRQALHGVLDLGVHPDVVEDAGGDPHLRQLVDHRLAHAHLEEVGVGDDERLLAVVVVLQLTQGHRRAALLEVHLLRQSQPQHILSPLRHGLDVQQLLDVGLAGEGAAAPGAGAQGQRRSRVEVVEVADAAEGGGHIDEDAGGLHPGAEGVDLLPLRGVHIQRAAVAGAALAHQLEADVQGLLEVLGTEHAQHGAQLLVGPGVVVAGVIRLGDQHLGVRRHGDARHLRQLHRRTAHSGGLHAVVGGVEEHLAHLLGLLGVQKVAAAVLELLLHLVVDAVQHRHVLLRRADHAVVKGLGVDGGRHRVLDVAGVVEDHVAVAGAHADGRGA